jgi:hypothetical protein
MRFSVLTAAFLTGAFALAPISPVKAATTPKAATKTAPAEKTTAPAASPVPAPAVPAAPAPPVAVEKATNKSNIDDFNEYCLQTPPSFDVLNLMAQKLKWPQASQGETPTNAHYRSWTVTAKNPPFILTAMTYSKNNSRFDACSIEEHDLSGADMKDELATALKLGDPVGEKKSPDGNRIETVWKTLAGPDTIMVTLDYYTTDTAKGYLLAALRRAP